MNHLLETSPILDLRHATGAVTPAHTSQPATQAVDAAAWRAVGVLGTPAGTLLVRMRLRTVGRGAAADSVTDLDASHAVFVEPFVKLRGRPGPHREVIDGTLRRLAIDHEVVLLCDAEQAGVPDRGAGERQLSPRREVNGSRAAGTVGAVSRSPSRARR
jgi:hypothetical protein